MIFTSLMLLERFLKMIVNIPNILSDKIFIFFQCLKIMIDIKYNHNHQEKPSLI
jgi:hypothetical protein